MAARLNAAAMTLFAMIGLTAQQKPVLTSDETEIFQRVSSLRDTPDNHRGEVTLQLALRIRHLPADHGKLSLAYNLANFATEGDLGRKPLQEVATTLSEALAEQPQPDDKNGVAMPYVTLAQLARYEGVDVSLKSSSYQKALDKLAADDHMRESADLTLPDLNGKQWTLSALRGKVVLVNFWATWCPPCRKEMPDLGALYKRFNKEGFVVLGISNEERGKVAPFVKGQHVPYPILLDTDNKVTTAFGVEGIPKSFLYARDGKLVATAIDMRTRDQFLAMLEKAGLGKK